MGAVGGGAWHFGKGTYNAPKGIANRLQGGVSVRGLEPHHGGAHTQDLLPTRDNPRGP